MLVERIADAWRVVRSHHKLLTRQERLLRLEKDHGRTSDRVVGRAGPDAVEFSPEFRERHIETRHTGDLVAVDTFFVGHPKGMGKVCIQTSVDCHPRYAWKHLYSNKLLVTAVHVMNNDVLPTFEAYQARITPVLSMVLWTARPSSL